jgi:hypothetical protein
MSTTLKRHPSQKQVVSLKKRNWKIAAKGLALRSPYNGYYYSPRMAVVIEARQDEQTSDDAS